MKVFDYISYKKFVNETIGQMPKAGRGQYRIISDHLSMSTVMVSQIFKGDRELGLEHAYKLSQYFQLSGLEKEYFFTMVLFARAGTHQLKEFHREKMDELKEKSKELKNILPQDKHMDEQQKARFYSHWYYSGIRLYSSLKDQPRDIASIAKRFNMPYELVEKVVEFLLENDLCLRDGQEISMGPARIHLESTSSYIKTRQMEWRLKGLECSERKGENEIFFTAPLSISVDGAKKVRKLIDQLTRDVGEQVVKEKPENLMCLNIDFYKF